MTTIMPEGELMRKAVKWICDSQGEEGKDVSSLIDEASVRFNLGPKQAEFLVKFFKDNPQPDPSCV